jgi:hypothetical protein
MGILEQIMQLKNQGVSDEEIINTLQQQGISPNEIMTALNQAEIKNAVTAGELPPAEIPKLPKIEEEPYIPTPTQKTPPQPTPETYYPAEEYYSPETNAKYQTESNTDIIIDIAEQVHSEKIRDTKKKIDSLTEFKTISQTKINNLEERLKKIETIIDKLQITIIEKIGSYGQNINNIKNEMTMIQESFSKIVKPLTEKHQTRKSTVSKKKK